ncbi:MAG: hypothetical protein IKL62_01945 [Clostridia bacterium]|nr:hypothetical protein [Clostridia bacterium]
MLEKDDWRLLNQKEYLMKAKLIKSIYKPQNEKSDHEHCCFCWDKFGDIPENLNVGFHTIDRRHWICEECFNDFKEMFGFEVISN